MTRGVMRTVLRRHLHDIPKVQWAVDSELDEILNVAYGLVQKEIRKFDPEAHISWDHVDTAANVNWYPLPATFSLISVGMKSSAADTLYVPILPKRYRDIGPWQITSGAVILAANASLDQTYYTLRGQWIGIYPAPPTTIDDGIELLHCPIMSMSSDDDVPRIKVPLHMAVVYWAKILATGETDETNGETRQRLQEILGDLPTWYNISSDEPDRLQVAV